MFARDQYNIAADGTISTPDQIKKKSRPLGIYMAGSVRYRATFYQGRTVYIRL